MRIKKFFRLDILLIVFMTSFLAFSFANHLGHSPRWVMLVIAGFLAVFASFRPKTAGLILLLFSAYFITANLAGYHLLSGDFISTYVYDLSHELYEWRYVYNYPGPLITLTLSLLFVFLLVFWQVCLVRRSRKYFFIVPMGIILYLWLGFQQYPGVERDLVVFLALAFSALALSYARIKNIPAKFGYHFCVFSVAALCSLTVFLLPNSAFSNSGGMHEYVQAGIADAYSQLQNWADFDFWEFRGNSVTSWGQIGYNPGGRLGGPIANSNTPVMEIELKKGSLPPALYLRGNARDYYTGNSWENIEAHPVRRLAPAFENVQVYEQEIELYVSYLKPENHLFGLFPITKLEFIDDDENKYLLDSFGNLRSFKENFDGDYQVTGKVVSRVDFEEIQPVNNLQLDKSSAAPFLQLPGDLPPRVVELSREITEESATEVEKAKQVRDFLREIPYNTFVPRPPEKGDFVDYFLFEHREGYCAYFASAMAVLLRAQGIPTRYVEGYRVPVAEKRQGTGPFGIASGGEEGEDETPQKITVRQNHAHAWVEVFLEGYGWVAFEPTSSFEIYDASPGDSESSETPESENEEEFEGGANEETPPDEFLTGGGEGGSSKFNWLKFVIISLGVFTTGSGLTIFYKLSHVKNPEKLYTRVIRLRSLFNVPPGSGETPGQIVDRLKMEMPELAYNFELMKHYYQRCVYYKEEEPYLYRDKMLKSLPLKTAGHYLKKLGFIKFVKSLLDSAFRFLRFPLP